MVVHKRCCVLGIVATAVSEIKRVYDYLDQGQNFMYESLYRHTDFSKSSKGLYYSFPLLKVYEKHGQIQKIPPQGVLTFCCCFLVINIFHRGLYRSPREAIGPEGANCFSRGVPISISKETYSHL